MAIKGVGMQIFARTVQQWSISHRANTIRIDELVAWRYGVVVLSTRCNFEDAADSPIRGRSLRWSTFRNTLSDPELEWVVVRKRRARFHNHGAVVLAKTANRAAAYPS